ncbi:uncharacterized protein N7515_008172 [Penicillium bovifimosum]|uniref:Uncharacterized protein n=1 Tax=Penicillium bovifimosum TaxID=126998 RepID=A0A9W9KX89_9EURO|nr:uncharacterized protein N7515_008172 [Penicillium bovifimosum]KAJ5124347.1 hypothetical protein N7515_008172 [Penicillium bovifimosum]
MAAELNLQCANGQPRHLPIAVDCLNPEGLQFRDDPGHWSCASVWTDKNSPCVPSAGEIHIQQAASGLSPDAAAASTPASSTHYASPHSHADPRSPSALPSGLPSGLPSVPPLGLPPAKRQRLTVQELS